ncbi:FAD-dependent monooxygenase [Streptomyces luteocolor]|uniref:FAD-dependent monooxygenase n=1 Tax=Streptomyces luteocolor TaxID=285500 RepID=UPI00099F5CE0|nr:FAD-dependent monooxygenase [Streptomyces luteocolor]
MNGTTGHTGGTENVTNIESAGSVKRAESAANPGGGGRADGVVVVGAGPTGLLLAGDLAAAGVPVTLVEKRAHGISNLSRAMVVHARTLEQLDARGLADELVAKGEPLSTLRFFGRVSFDLTDLPSRFPHVLVLPQYEVERTLERRAVEAGVRFAYETEVVGLGQDADGVTLDVRGPGGTPGGLRAAYAVGADGLRSGVRQGIGLPFPGRSVIRSLVLADVRFTEPPESLLALNGVGDAFAVVVPFADGYYRVVGWNRAHDVPDSAPLDLDEVKEIVRAALGRDFGMHDARWMSRFHSDERQAPAYRVGRVFLAGDAAHVHSPAGGQGMNTGLQDAANLGWKLIAVLGGRAPDGLLDTYQTERHPVGRQVLRSSGGLIRLAMAKHVWTRAARAAVVALVGHVPALRAEVVGRVTGIGIAYRAPKGAHRLTGRRVPDVALKEGRLHEVLRAGEFVLVAPGGEQPPTGRAVPAHWSSGRRTTVLVRPDGYVAWAADGAAAGEVAAALRTWGAA